MPTFSAPPTRFHGQSAAPLLAGAVEPVVDLLTSARPRFVDLGTLTGRSADVALAELLEHPARAADLGALSRIDPDDLSTKRLQLAYSRRVDEVLACGAALQVRATAVLAGSEPSGDYLAEVAAETEISLARTISPPPRAWRSRRRACCPRRSPSSSRPSRRGASPWRTAAAWPRPPGS